MLELIIDKNKYSDYGEESYKGFFEDMYQKFSPEYSDIEENFNYDAYTFKWFLINTFRFQGIKIIIKGVDLYKVLAARADNSEDDNWRNIIFEMEDAARNIYPDKIEVQ